ncbi:putative uncharacterized protein, partial [groundwater metagenome]
MNKELRRDRHTVSLLTDHLVITPKYRGKILTLMNPWIFKNFRRVHQTGEVGFVA